MNDLNTTDQDMEINFEAVFSKRRHAMFDCIDDYNDSQTASQTGRSLNLSLDQVKIGQDELSRGISELSDNKCMKNKVSSYRLYQMWNGNNVFCLNGKMLNGLKQKSLQSRTTLLLIVGSFLIYMVFPAFYLYDKISPYLALLTIYMFILTMFFYCMTFT